MGRRKSLSEVMLGLLMCTVGWIGARWILRHKNQDFLRRGKLPEAPEPAPPASR